MTREIGCKKYGGRKKGTPNKRTSEFKDFFDSIGFSIPEEIYKSLDLLDPDKKVDTLLKLLEYIYPKRKALDVQVENKSHESQQIDLKLLSREELLFLKDLGERQQTLL